MSLLAVRDLTVAYAVGSSAANVVVSGVELVLEPGVILGVAGESGCGKSTAALAAVGYRTPGATVLSGSSRLGDADLISLAQRDLRRIWGRRISYVAQDASASLNPLKRIGWLLAEPLRDHLGLRGVAAKRRSIEILESVGITGGASTLRRFPHEFSGGQQQRIALAIAMSCRPDVLILDEPTTGLDVTTQAQISRLINALVRDSDVAALYISHDLALLATVCDDIVIMYAGEIMERAPARDLYSKPRHPYTSALLDAVPRITESARTVGLAGRPPSRVMTEACPFVPRCRFAVDRCRQEHPELEAVSPVHIVRCFRAREFERIPSQRTRVPPALRTGSEPQLEVSQLRCSYPGRHAVVAVDDVSITVSVGETLGIVGESGSGKSTLLRAIAGLHRQDTGSIAFEGQSLHPRASRRPRSVRRAIQLVFQHPDSSLNPRHTIASAIQRPLQLFRPDLDRRGQRQRVSELLDDVRLDQDVARRYPHQLSGGQKQRVALARAFAADPRLILCDEVVSALDVSVQASILELLARLTVEHGTALVFVTHDLAVVRSIADRVCVMGSGRVCETGWTNAIFEESRHPYTLELLSAVPNPEAVASLSP